MILKVLKPYSWKDIVKNQVYLILMFMKRNISFFAYKKIRTAETESSVSKVLGIFVLPSEVMNLYFSLISKT